MAEGRLSLSLPQQPPPGSGCSDGDNNGGINCVLFGQQPPPGSGFSNGKNDNDGLLFDQTMTGFALHAPLPRGGVLGMLYNSVDPTAITTSSDLDLQRRMQQAQQPQEPLLSAYALVPVSFAQPLYGPPWAPGPVPPCAPTHSFCWGESYPASFVPILPSTTGELPLLNMDME